MKHFFNLILSILGAISLLSAPAHASDVLTPNSTPADTWHYGTGNDYSPANSLVLTTDAGDELALRMHQTFQVAPASVGNVYSFVTGLPYISFDWSIDSHTGFFQGVTASLTVFTLGGGSFTYDPLALGNDNSFLLGSQQNSGRLNSFIPATGFDPNVDGTHGVTLTVEGFEGGTKTLTAYAKVGEGYVSAAVPEPATWLFLLLGFGFIGLIMRRPAQDNRLRLSHS